MIFLEEPVVIDVRVGVGWYDNRLILVVELLLHLTLVEFRQGGRFSVLLFIFIRADFLTVILIRQFVLLLLPFLVRFDVFLVLLIEEVLLLQEESLTVRLSLRLGLFLAGLFLPVLLLNGLSAYHILLSRLNRHLEPLEEFAKACVVSINFLLREGRDDPLAVVDPVIRLVLALLLTPNFIIAHLLRQPFHDEFLSFLPAEFVRVGLTDALALHHVKEEECLDDMWHLKHSE